MAIQRRHAWWWAGALTAAAAARSYATRRYFRTEPGPSAFMHEDLKTAWTPGWRETLAPVQWLRLQRSPAYRGDGVPRGDGSAVLLVQGFLTRPSYLATLRGWLARLGYHARIADIGWNADCLDALADRIIAQAARVRRESDSRVHLIGHSLGGILARAVAARVPELVASVATLATPFRGLRLHPSVRLTNLVVRAVVHRRRDPAVFPECLTLACQCATVRSLATPLPSSVPQLAVVVPGDGVADWRYEADPASMRVVEVPGSHVGVVFEPATYEALAQHLASARAASALRSVAGA